MIAPVVAEYADEDRHAAEEEVQEQAASSVFSVRLSPASYNAVRVAAARAHLAPSALIRQWVNERVDAMVEAGETVVITRRGKPVVEMSARRKPREKIDVGWLREQTAKIPHSPTDSGDLLRQMRDEARY